MLRGTRPPSGRGGGDNRQGVSAAAGASSRGGVMGGGAVASATPTHDDDKESGEEDEDAEAHLLASATPTHDDDKESGEEDEDAEAHLLASATPTHDDDKESGEEDEDAEAHLLASATPTQDDDKESGEEDEDAEARLERAMTEWLAQHEDNTTVSGVQPSTGGRPPTGPRAGRRSIEDGTGKRVPAASVPATASPVILVGDSSTTSASSPASPRQVEGSTTTSASRWSSPCMSEDSSGEEIVPVGRSRKRRLRCGTRSDAAIVEEVSRGVLEARTGSKSAHVGGVGCAEEEDEDVAGGGADDSTEGLGEDDLLQRRGVDWSVVDSGDDDSGDDGDDDGRDAPGDVGKAQAPSPSGRSTDARRSGGLRLSITRYSKKNGVFGEMRVPLRTKTTAMRSDWVSPVKDDPRTAPWVSLDGQADRSGRHAFPPGATRSEKRKWRKVMRMLKKAMPTILEEAARAAAEGVLHPQTVATDPAARKVRSEESRAKFVYVYVHVKKGGCKTCVNAVYCGRRCYLDTKVMTTVQGAFNNRDIAHHEAVAGGDNPTPFDIHYRRHPKAFWRTIVYYYTGPDGDIPIRMAVAAVERAVYRLLEGHGIAALNNNTPSLSAVPLVPIVGDTDEWRKLRAELVAYKEKNGDMRIGDTKGRLGTRLHIVRLQRGLGDPAEEQWLTDQDFEWEADRASRAERALHARQGPLVKDMIAWLENHGGELPMSFTPRPSNKRLRGDELESRRVAARLYNRWTNMIRTYGGVSLDHAKRVNAAFLRGRGCPSWRGRGCPS
ncbi:hypothetical protein I4F81_007579 [Pyropia yezoensis]|uniref:Uncharacterized protein n=1 Tax=Pyropia yezoensis TaxID=2788 RepID=A0ACC3C513_PYRYE|nr:hypothetical protein I4F81_007579 [Neopyropia yezoensis]